RRARVADRMRARRARAAAHVGSAGIAVVRAGRAVRLENVVGTAGAGSGAGLGDVTFASGPSTQRARVARRMLAGVVRAVALVEGAGVAVVSACRPARLPRTVGGTRRARAGAGLGEIAVTGGGAAGLRAVEEGAVVLAAGARCPVQCTPQVAVFARIDVSVAAGSGGIGECRLRGLAGGAPRGGQR